VKVLSLVPGLDPARGGIASAATSMSLAARMVGVDCVVAVPEHGSGDAASRGLIVELQRAGVVVHTLPVVAWPPRSAYRWGLSPAQTAWTLRNVKRFDVVHVHGAWGLGSLTGLLAGRAARTPVVVTAHESLTRFDIDGSRSAARRRQKLVLKSLYLRHATLFVLNSEIEARVSLPPSARRRTVYLPVTRADGPARAVRPRGQGRLLRVGFLARIHPKKNLDVLIDAMSHLPGHVRLVIAGDGPADLIHSLRRQADRLGVSERVEWLGFVEPAERSDLFARLDLLAMPSAFESFGLAAAEAMLEGLPVLVSERTGIAEVIVRHGGGRVIKVDAASVASAIRQLDVERGSFARLAVEGQLAVRTDLDYTRIGLAIRAAYDDAVAAC
jgi:glycosyltransferase involved in cell wall biosynthesis